MSPRPKSSSLKYAESLGIRQDRLARLGGEEKLRSLSPDARAVLLRKGSRRKRTANAPLPPTLGDRQNA